MSLRARKWIRVGFAGPGAFIIALVIMAGMALWLPQGAAQIDNLVFPLILFPLIWAALFFHACLDGKLTRVAAVALGLCVIHAGLVANKFMSKSAASPAAAHEAKS